MKNIVVYFPYELSSDLKSGSKVRPMKMIKAFDEYAHKNNLELIVISGDTQKRKELIESFRKLNKVHNTLFCYIENSTIPYWLTNRIQLSLFVDSGFWKFLSGNHIPIGLFYRDVYWKFDDLYTPPRNKRYLKPVMRKLYKHELNVFSKIVDVLFLPSLEMNDSVQWHGKIDELPPGMEETTIPSQSISTESQTAIFVGGIKDDYGIKMMLEAFKKVNEKYHVTLVLICRENDYKKNTLIQQYAHFSWLKVAHKFGKELHEEYKKANIALIPRRKNVYHDFSMPVKMFEYLSFGLPIVATNCSAQSRLIEKESVGVVTKDNVNDFTEGILQAIDPERYKEMRNNIAHNINERHSWDARVEKVARVLRRK